MSVQHTPRFMKGPTSSSFENLSAGLSQYRFGVDFRLLARTRMSYDQTWSYYKTDPGLSDQNQLSSASVAGSTPRLIWESVWNGPPCSPTFQPGGLVNPELQRLL